eukprot:scaffold12843_cov113-Isochrysis_galbana.AAC.7
MPVGALRAGEVTSRDAASATSARPGFRPRRLPAGELSWAPMGRTSAAAAIETAGGAHVWSPEAVAGWSLWFACKPEGLTVAGGWCTLSRGAASSAGPVRGPAVRQAAGAALQACRLAVVLACPGARGGPPRPGDGAREPATDRQGDFGDLEACELRSADSSVVEEPRVVPREPPLHVVCEPTLSQAAFATSPQATHPLPSSTSRRAGGSCGGWAGSGACSPKGLSELRVTAPATALEPELLSATFGESRHTARSGETRAAARAAPARSAPAAPVICAAPMRPAPSWASSSAAAAASLPGGRRNQANRARSAVSPPAGDSSASTDLGKSPCSRRRTISRSTPYRLPSMSSCARPKKSSTGAAAGPTSRGVSARSAPAAMAGRPAQRRNSSSHRVLKPHQPQIVCVTSPGHAGCATCQSRRRHASQLIPAMLPRRLTKIALVSNID